MTRGRSKFPGSSASLLVSLTVALTAVVLFFPSTSHAAATAVEGRAFGYHAFKVTLFDSPQPSRGPTPMVDLAPDASNSPQTATSPEAQVAYGPAVLFSSGQITVRTEGSVSPGRLVTSSTDVTDVNRSGSEVFDADRVQSTCTGSDAGVTGSTTITNGTLRTHAQADQADPPHDEVFLAIPTNPAPGRTEEGHLHLGATSQERFRYVFNEQVTNPDGSLTVNAVHAYFLGPTLKGELIIGQSVCGAIPSFVPVPPERLLDTRANAQIGYTGAKPAAGSVVQLQVTGAGTTKVPADAAAVVLNVTGVSATKDGFVTVWPCGTDPPLASNLNLTTGAILPNLVISKVGAGGKVCLYTSGGTHLLADVSGYFPAGTDYRAVPPERLLDTRANAQTGYTGGKPAAGSVVELQVTGAGETNVPTDAAAVVLNVTGVSATKDGFVTVWPCGPDRPLASNLNLTTGAILPNLVISKVGAGGKVCLYTSGGTHLLADVSGYFTATLG